MDNYYLIYFLILGVFSFFYFTSSPKKNFILIYFISLFFVVYFGTRSEEIGSDTQSYRWIYTKYIEASKDLKDYISKHSEKSIVFTRLVYYTVKEFGFNNFLFFVSLIEVGMFLLGLLYIKKYFKKNEKFIDVILLALLYGISFFFININVNIILNGLAIFTFFLSFISFLNKKYFISILFLLVSLDFHISIILPFLAILAVNYSKKINVKYFYALFIIGIIISFLEINLFGDYSILFDNISKNKFDSYINFDETEYKTGFRLDFVIFNTIFLLPSLFHKNDIIVAITKYFCITSFVFFISSELIYNDRIGLYSWMSLPLILYFFIDKIETRHYRIYLILLYLGLNLILVFK